MEFVNELLLSKNNISEQLILLRKHNDNKCVQEYIKTLESSEYLSDYVKYMIERYYYGNKNAVKSEKNCVEKTFKVLLRPVKAKEREFAETNIKIGDEVSIIDGPFKDLEGRVKKVNENNALFVIVVNLFDQDFDVEVEFEYAVKK